MLFLACIPSSKLIFVFVHLYDVCIYTVLTRSLLIFDHPFIQNKNILSSKRWCWLRQTHASRRWPIYVKKHLPPSGESVKVTLPDSSPKFFWEPPPREPPRPPPLTPPPNPEAFPRGRPPCDPPPKFPKELDVEGGGRRFDWRCWPPGSKVLTPPCGYIGSSSSW